MQQLRQIHLNMQLVTTGVYISPLADPVCGSPVSETEYNQKKKMQKGLIISLYFPLEVQSMTKENS